MFIMGGHGGGSVVVLGVGEVTWRFGDVGKCDLGRSDAEAGSHDRPPKCAAHLQISGVKDRRFMGGKKREPWHDRGRSRGLYREDAHDGKVSTTMPFLQ